ncbi:nucleotidyltransferase domain-containing protein [Polyangium mundeleinium]|uniref:Nucleotidyltransferase domain-containing protein n=1 Tax=Polyangium mundeleinium TaxID=2995306 RepID=A0ABT5EQV9_9BACT|nr:nucleotidyltransferase domain-containing protein [Polyangium mundeleinium]MDC0744215.1 nucleotidyltransferase domain-containing protein [Polyangium mundeleinium]
MSSERTGGLRARVAVEAARLMYEEGVKQYFTAKRMAARRLLGHAGGKNLRYRPQDLPSNGEIRDALLAMAELAEGERRTRRLFAMRVVALRVMRALGPFEPRLIGSVSTGHIRRGSDIDIQVFTDDEDTFERHLVGLGWTFERERVSIFKFGQIREYVHYHVVDLFPVELTVYERRELRFRPRSSTDGQPIQRVKATALEALLVAEHPEAWAQYEADGSVADLDDILAEEEDEDAPLPGPYDGLLAEDPVEEAWPPGGEDEPDEDYDPLPGFEAYSD